MSEVLFLEYNVNPDEHNISDAVILLRGLGFNEISIARNHQATMWAVNKCVFLLSRHPNMPTGITGIGLNSDAVDGSKYCETTGMNVGKGPSGLNIYTYPIEKFKETFDKHFITTNEAGTDLPLSNFVGIIYGNKFNPSNVISNELKFKNVKTTENYTTTVCSNNRFNILWDNHSNTGSIDKIIIKTDDIVDATAKMITKGYSSETISHHRRMQINKILDAHPEEFIAKHILSGWDLNLAGRTKSYVIEKCFENALPNLDIILSKQYNHNGVNEETLMYYSTISENKNVTVQ